MDRRSKCTADVIRIPSLGGGTPEVRMYGGCYAMNPSWGAEPPEKESSRDLIYIGILTRVIGCIIE